MILPSACSRLVESFDGQGWHRTASAVDDASAQWLLEELSARGVAGSLDTYPFSRIDPEDCSVRGEDWEIPGYPFIDSVLPRPGSEISGVVADEPGPGRIAFLRAGAHLQTSPVDAFRLQPWEAIVVAMEGQGFTLRNQWHIANPYGPPVIQVPIARAGPLEVQRAAGRPITIRCGASVASVSASNVSAKVPGSHPELAPIYVLTPRSGWWHCAGERGGGIAAWVEVAGQVRRRGLARDVVFLATTGHELGFWGIRRHIERHSSAEVAAAHFWIHLGANVGARNSPTVVRSGSQVLLDLAKQVDHRLRDSAVNPDWELRATPPGGEAEVVAAHGGSYISMVGRGFDLFHSNEDRWPAAIDAGAIARNAQLVLEILLQSEPAYRI